jgi:hypothetical protein
MILQAKKRATASMQLASNNRISRAITIIPNTAKVSQNVTTENDIANMIVEANTGLGDSTLAAPTIIKEANDIK